MKRYVKLTNGNIVDTQAKKDNFSDTNPQSEFFIKDKELIEKYYILYGENGMWCTKYDYKLVGYVKEESDKLEDLCEYVTYFENDALVIKRIRDVDFDLLIHEFLSGKIVEIHLANVTKTNIAFIASTVCVVSKDGIYNRIDWALL